MADMTASPYRRLLVGTGGAPHSQLAIERAAELARYFGATLHVVTVIPRGRSALGSAAAALAGSSEFEAQLLQDEEQRRAAHLQQTAAGLRERGLQVEEHLAFALKPADAILAVAQEVGADLILLGRRHTSAWSAALAGSVSDMVSHASPVDVLIVR